MGPGNQHLGTPGAPADLHHVDLDPVALPVALAGDLLLGGEQRFGALPTGADLHVERPAAGVGAGDHAGNQLLGLAHKLLVDHVALRLPDALDNHLACGLGGDAAEVLGFQLAAHHVPQLHCGQEAPGLLQRDLRIRVGHFLHHVPADNDPHRVLLRVREHYDVFLRALVVPLVGGHQGLGDLLHHICFGNAFFLFNHVQGRKKFFCFLLRSRSFLLCGSSGHVTASLLI